MSTTTTHNCDRCGEEIPSKWSVMLWFFTNWTGLKNHPYKEIELKVDLCKSCESLIILKLSEIKKEFTQKKKA